APACASRSAGAAAPNPVPITRTSVWIVFMVGRSRSGSVPVGRQRRGEEHCRVGVRDLGQRVPVVAALETDEGAAPLRVVDACVERDLGEGDGAVVHLAGGRIVLEAVPDDGGALVRREPLERRLAEAALAAPRQVRREGRGGLGEGVVGGRTTAHPLRAVGGRAW